MLSGCDCDPPMVPKPCWANCGLKDLGYVWHLCSSHSNRLSLPPQSISAMKLMQFQGLKHKASSPISLPPVSRLDLTPSPEVPLSIMKRKLMSTNDVQEARRLVQKIDRLLEVSGGEVAGPSLTAERA